MVPAPGLLSITTVWPQVFDSRSAIARARTSTPPPAGNGTTRRTIRVGNCSAIAGCNSAALATTRKRHTRANLVTRISQRYSSKRGTARLRLSDRDGVAPQQSLRHPPYDTVAQESQQPQQDDADEHPLCLAVVARGPDHRPDAHLRRDDLRRDDGQERISHR